MAPAGRRRVLAVDGKALRGSRHTDRGGLEVAGRHLLSVIEHDTRVMLDQVNVDGKTNEITTFNPLNVPFHLGDLGAQRGVVRP
ncbi:transposase [Amycolatopsis sulphurea]|uniref:transposase n=1 Tax=Amycolatopsis sulphurea TaxID=76022 RepID=UPI000BF5CB75